MGLTAGLMVLASLPISGHATAADLLSQLTPNVAQLVGAEPASETTDDAAREAARLAELERQQQQQEEDLKTQPPLHGANPHGQGTVAVIDVNPSPDRPTGSDPAGSDTGEETVVGRARGEQREDGSYHGHITVLALFGNEIVGVDTAPGQTETGPLNAVQEGLLTPVCDGSGGQICITAATADSTTTENGSTNRFSAAHVTIGGAEGIDAGVAESNGNISDDGTCQTAHGDSSVASVSAGGQAVADLAESSTDSRACKGQPPTQTNDSRVVALGGTGVPLPAPECAEGTEVVTGIPTIAPVVCNADDTDGAQAAAPYGVREALSVFAIDAGGSQVLKTTTAASESRAQAPPPQCSDTEDNDGDGKADAADPGCLSGPGGAYNPNDDNEGDEAGTQCSDGADNDGDGLADAADPGCHTDGDASNPASFDPNDDDERNAERERRDRDREDRPECSDDRDNDGDGEVDRDDPGCLSGPGGEYDPDDDSEDDGRAAACANGVDDDGDGLVDRDDPGCLSGPGGTYDPTDDSEADDRRELGALAVTGSETLLLAIAGLFLLGAGLDLRRRLRAGAAG